MIKDHIMIDRKSLNRLIKENIYSKIEQYFPSSAWTVKSTIWQILFLLLLIKTRYSNQNWVICLYLKIFQSGLPGEVLVCVNVICLYGQILSACTLLSGPSSPKEAFYVSFMLSLITWFILSFLSPQSLRLVFSILAFTYTWIFNFSVSTSVEVPACGTPLWLCVTSDSWRKGWVHT